MLIPGAFPQVPRPQHNPPRTWPYPVPAAIQNTATSNLLHQANNKPRNWAPKKNVNDLMFQPSGVQRRSQWRVPWGDWGIDGNGWSDTITSFQVLCLDFQHWIFTLSKILGSRKGQDVDWMFLGLVWEWYTSVSSALASWTTLYKMKS